MVLDFRCCGNGIEDLVLILGAVSTLVAQLMCRQSERWTNAKRIIKIRDNCEKLWNPMSQNDGKRVWTWSSQAEKTRPSKFILCISQFEENLYNGVRQLVMKKIEPKINSKSY